MTTGFKRFVASCQIITFLAMSPSFAQSVDDEGETVLRGADEKSALEHATYQQWLEIYRQRAYQIPLQVAEDEIQPKLYAHFQQMNDLAKRAPTPELAQNAANITIDTLRKTGNSDVAAQWAPRYLKEYFSTCHNYLSCSLLLQNLSSFVETAPETTLDHLNKMSMQFYFSVHESRQKEQDPKVRAHVELLSKLIDYRLHTVFAQLHFYRDSKLNEVNLKGRTPRLGMDSHGKITKQLDQLTGKLSAIEKIKDGLLEAQKNLANDEETLNVLKLDLIEALKASQLLNQTLKLYLTRVNKKNLRPWIAELHEGARKGTVDPEIAVLTAVRFVDVEAVLPFRDLWAAIPRLMSKTAQKSEWAAFAEYTERIVLFQDMEMVHLLEQYGFFEGKDVMKRSYSNRNELTAHIDIFGTLGEHLLSREKQLSVQYITFESLYSQIQRMSRRVVDMGEIAAEYRNETNNKRKADLEHSLTQQSDNTLQQWLLMACFAEYSRGFVPARWPQKHGRMVHTSFSPNGKAINMSKVCPPSDSETLHRESPEKPIINYLMAQGKWRAWKPFLIEAAIAIATVPISIYAGNLAGVVSNTVSASLISIGTQTAVRYSLGRVATFVLTKAIPKVAAAIMSSITFAFVQKSSLALVTWDFKRLYDKDKTLMQQYGADILMSSIMYGFFKPLTDSAVLSLRLKMYQSSFLRNHDLIRQTLTVGAKTFADQFIVLPNHYIKKYINERIYGSDEAAITGFVGFLVQSGKSANSTLYFNFSKFAMY